MAINVEVQQTEGESGLTVLRRFSKRVQGAGILNRVRGIRYNTRNQSPLARKKKALKRLNRKKEIEHLQKLGKMPEKKERRK